MKTPLVTSALGLWAALVLTSWHCQAQVVINEIHYSPQPDNEPVEFIEFFNAGPETVDLSGWRLTDGVAYTFPENVSLEAGAYLVLALNETEYNKKFGSIFAGGAQASGEFASGRLSNGGETILLEDAAGTEQDRVDYKDSFPWPVQAGGDGPSMELIHPALDNDLGGSWRSSSAPTPGQINSVYSETAPPQIRQVDHVPRAPRPGEEVIVKAKVSDPDGVAEVVLHYQLVLPGDYIALEDARYETDWTEVSMADDGIAPDTAADDEIFTAALPGTLQSHRALLRYRIVASDTTGTSVRAPYEDDYQPNFACFTYGDLPPWTGAVEPGETEPVTFEPEVLQSVPVYHLITTKENHVDSQYLSGTSRSSGYTGSDYLWRGTFVYDGDVYDHIRFRARGGVWRYAMGKNMWKFLFNRGREFVARNEHGEAYTAKWKRLNFSAIIQQGDFGHRGEQGLFESVGFDLFRKAGVPAPRTHFVHFRIVENPRETNVFGSQYATDFQGLYLAIEQIDGRFLDSRDLPKGNIYKMENGTGIRGLGGELKHLGNYPSVSDYSDLEAFKADGYERRDQEADWWRSHFNLANYYGYRSIVEYIHHYDTGAGKNYYYYHNPEDGIWQILPWDLDLTWDDGMYATPSPHLFTSTALAIDEFYRDYQNRLVEIGDLLFNAEQTGMLIDEKAAAVYTPGQPSLVDADRMMWDYNPIMTSAYVKPSKSGAGRYYRITATDDFAGMIERMKAYIPHRRAFAANQLINENRMPGTPTATYVGDDGFPVDGLRFESSSFRGGSIFQPQAFGAMKWRIAEVTDPSLSEYSPEAPNHYEIDAAWESEEIPTFTPEIEIPVTAVRPGSLYRVRVRMKNDAGYWGSWSDPVQFVAASPDLAPFQEGLVISEILYAPAAATDAEREAGFDTEDFEYIELTNVSSSEIDLRHLRFTKGIDYDFIHASQTALAPGEVILLVRDQEAFEARFGTGLPVVGSYKEEDGGNRLDNAGENLKLSFGAGLAIREFDYRAGDGWPVVEAGESIILVNPSDVPAHEEPSSWRAGASAGGTPGEVTMGGSMMDYDTWKTMIFTTDQLADSEFVAATADPDADGWPNLLEYAFFGDPVSADAIGPAIAGGSDGPILQARHRTDASDLDYRIEFSIDLVAWTDLEDNPEAATLSSDEPLAAGGRESTYLLRVPGSFWRVAVTLSP